MDCTLAFLQPYAGNTLKSGSLHPMIPLGSYTTNPNLFHENMGEVKYNDPLPPGPTYGLKNMDAGDIMEFMTVPGQLWFVAHCCFDCVTEDLENATAVVGGMPDVELRFSDGPLVNQDHWDDLPFTEVPHDVIPAVAQWYCCTMQYDTDDSRTVRLLRKLDEHTAMRFLR